MTGETFVSYLSPSEHAILAAKTAKAAKAAKAAKVLEKGAEGQFATNESNRKANQDHKSSEVGIQ